MAQGDGHSKYGEFIRTVKDRTDIVELVKESAPDIERLGQHWMCRSPLRADKDPSFAVYPDGGWHDFGTRESGDCFSFVMRRDNTDFNGSVSVLARRAGIELYWENKLEDKEGEQYVQEAKMLAESQAVFEILTEAAAYYHSVLPKKIREEYYNKNYGLSDETIDRLRLGYASGGLAEYFLETKGYSQEMLVKTGLFWKHQDKIVDLFQDRLFIPYWKDHKTVYAIARKTEFTDTTSDHEKAKYKKLPVHSERRSYISKYISNEFFYNEDVCFKKTDKIIITEGVTDCIAATQHGFACISPVTVRFRTQDIPKLIELLHRAKTQIVYLCNDADVTEDGEEPGKKGALATAGALVGSGFEVRICQLPKPEGVVKVDLCEFLRDNGPESFQKVLDSAKKYVEFLIDEIPITLDRSELDGRLKPLLETIAPWPDITRDAYTKHIASRFKISKKVLEKAVALLRPKEPPKPVVADDSSPPSARKSIVPDRQRGVVYEDIGFYYVENKQGGTEIISSFTLRMKEKIFVDGNLLVRCDIEGAKNTFKDFTFPKNAWGSKRDFIRSLPSPTDFQWTGTDDEVQGLLKILGATDVTTKQGTTNIGYNALLNKWVWHGGVISSDGFVETSDEIVYIVDGSNIHERVIYKDVPTEELRIIAKEVLPDLFKINSPEVILPLIGWFYSTPFKSRLHKLLSHFPILHIWGSPGSGKSSVIKDIFWPLMGVFENKEPFSCTDTLFAIIKKMSSTDSVPLFFDEYKPSDMGRQKVDQFHRILRRLYGGETEERGRADLTLSVQHLRAPTVVAGEMPILEDPALSERIISVSPNKNFLMQSMYAKETFYKLRDKFNLSLLAGSYVQWSLSVDMVHELEESKQYLNSILTRIHRNEKLTPRVYDNLLVVVFGIRMFEQWATSLGAELPLIDPVKAFSDVTNEILEGEGSNVKDSFDSFLEGISTLAQRKLLEEDIHYACIDGNLYINMSVCHQMYCLERKKLGKEDDTGGQRALTRLAQEKIQRGNSYVINVGHRVRMGDSSIRCIGINMNTVPAHLNFERFPVSKVRSRGGFRNSSGGNWGPTEGDA